VSVEDEPEWGGGVVEAREWDGYLCCYRGEEEHDGSERGAAVEGNAAATEEALWSEYSGSACMLS
jgi:hypothetical protein